METQFNTICEDGSPDEIGELLVTMWRLCGEGNFSMVSDILGREFVRHDTISRSHGLEGGDAMDSDDEEMGVDSDSRRGCATAEGDFEMIEEGAEDAEAESATPFVDPDGWQTVPVRGKRGTGKKR